MEIVLCVTGSVAAIEAVKLARELRRQGASVRCFMSEDACRIIHPYAMEFATGSKPILELTGEIEHVKYADSDLILVAPATANIIGKLAFKLADNPISSLLLTASGMGTPIVMVPSMHEAMYAAAEGNIQRLREEGVVFVEPRMDEGKAKFPDINTIVLEAMRQTSKQSLRGKRFLISLGGTYEPIDPVRGITNRSSGKMGLAVARRAYIEGADVTLLAGVVSVDIPQQFTVVGAETADSMASAVRELIGEHDVFVSAAAVADFKPTYTGRKISSDGELTLTLKPNPKIIKIARELNPDALIVGFKAEYDVPREELIRSAEKQMQEAGVDIVVANDVSVEGFGSDSNRAIIVSDKAVELPVMSKDDLASLIVDEIAVKLEEKE
ncbi:bifunctional phosphopantothenoylcysteine decarboxylase/phosphopantothenate--cysteine ligase CoaBC [Methanothermobacter sp. K4]|uniref:bifunctional phosphopantothenoylcysteine decarboxylase/phosphopantothenate--cysteine ligase CoaBC n=1 Tax=Methanothermobacter sp. K4 TaxID=2913262 RepID=UPI001EDBED8A|nr:bifunctional phosphopantothenoylcysteine decarboxylase/phosphopantothenate--cysteine ligase CoaBC [Methanothermobacter sp. K4]MCG2828124.1 bifunctional phosphopantothenoylcysteine decarboxylase/phosphopantothenate--cysteine ligase CoaBC [Methanothermobacter sp. K4]